MGGFFIYFKLFYIVLQLYYIFMYICFIIIKNNNMELLKIENLDLTSNTLEDFYINTENTLTAVFDGLFPEGFYITTEFSYDEETIEEEEEETNCKTILAPTNLNFWDFKTFDSDENEISINDRELKKIKELVEFKLIDLLSDELNNN